MSITNTVSLQDETPSPGFSILARQSLFLFPVSLLTRVANLVKFIVIARTFGASAHMDAFWIAWNIPGGVGGVAEGACEHAFVALGTQARVRKPGSEWSLQMWLLLLFSTVFCLVTLIYVLLAGSIIRWLGPGLPDDSRQIASQLTVLLAPILFLSPAFGLLTAFHYTHERYTLRTAVPALGALVIVCASYFAGRRYGIQVLAWAYTASLLLQVLPLAPFFWRSHAFRDELPQNFLADLRKVLLLIVPMAFVNFAGNTNLIVDRVVASHLGTGAISNLDYASKVGTLLLDICIGGFLVAFYPFMAQQAAHNEPVQAASRMEKSLRLSLFLIIPAIGFAAFLRVPLLQLLLERGAFTHGDTIAAAQAFLAYSPSFIFQALNAVLVRGFYSYNDSWTPMVVLGAGIIPNLLLDVLFSRYIGFLGIAASSSLVNGIIFACLAVAFQRKHLSVDFKQIGKPALRMLSSVVLALITIHVGSLFWPRGWGDSFHSAGIIALTFSVTMCLALYFAWLSVLGGEETSLVASSLKRLPFKNRVHQDEQKG
ncbi:MAG: hypothetical protein A3G41_04250 [Elusimicrobia bacterium RIFCSPLOWO2_12_FULL_59_9]|nr:MAG: hypothetical protein A3G41_04250 [Elusimicrobia bacterium RIFCSPLOWO2_12_FULL_59_9]